MTSSNRTRVIDLYKRFLLLGREWPQGYPQFRDRCKAAFYRNKETVDAEEIELMIKRGEFVIKEIEALYRLKKYRTMKRRYYPEADP